MFSRSRRLAGLAVWLGLLGSSGCTGPIPIEADAPEASGGLYYGETLSAKTAPQIAALAMSTGEFKDPAVIIAIARAALSSSAAGNLPIENSASLVLTEKNFNVVKTGVTAGASTTYFLGIFPLGPTNIANIAMAELSSKASQAASGEKRFALANFAGDQIFHHFFIFTRQTISLRADVVEFQ
jgi:hypothetical protein